MEGEHTQEINSINAQINQTKIDHELFIEKLEANYNEKLIMEYNKYLRFEAKMDKMLKESDNRYMDLKKLKEDSEESIARGYEEKLKENETQFEEVCKYIQFIGNKLFIKFLFKFSSYWNKLSRTPTNMK